jgi:hypothetical protein
MKALVILIILVCTAVALWYFRDDITGMRLRFVEREEAGARFKAPNWRASSHDKNPADGHLILKHKRKDKRIFYLAWQSAEEPPTSSERAAAAKEFARVLGEMTRATATVKPLDVPIVIGDEKARQYSFTFTGTDVGPGELCMWYVAKTRQRWYFVIVDDDLDEHERIAREFLDSFKPGSAPVEAVAATGGKLAFDAPAGWRILDETPTQIAYVSPNEDALLELHHGTRTSRSQMTKEYADTLAARMIEAAGATWEHIETRLAKDARLDAVVATVRGTARMHGEQRHYLIRLWISSRDQRLYVAALSAVNARSLDEFRAVLDRISIAQ